MTDYAVAESGDISARFIFPEEFLGFQGHFPGNRILPGVCQIQCVVAMLEKWRGAGAVLKEMVLVKFFSPVFPSEELACTCRNIEEKNGTLLVKAVLQRGDTKIADMKLRVQFQQGID